MEEETEIISRNPFYNLNNSILQIDLKKIFYVLLYTTDGV